MIEKIWGLIEIYYQLQNNCAIYLHCLTDRYAFLDPDFDKI